MPKTANEPDYTKPVAYDEHGRPLYAHPPTVTAKQPEGAAPQVVYMTRAISPHQQDISPEVSRKHDESQARYSQLNLSEGEFVISAVKRHPIGLISIWAVVILAVILLLAIPFIIASTSDVVPLNLTPAAVTSGVSLILLGVVLIILGGLVATVVYDANRFYLTNESVTQLIQSGLFSRRSQTISLNNIEDASYTQKGILQTIFNYGSIRLSTEGEETTYRFAYVANPQQQVRLLNDAIEAFKNFRPIGEDEAN